MCGIAGLFDPTRSGAVDRLGAEAAAMAASLAHRGPDDDGLWVDPDGRIAFGHRRLAVVDLSPHGHQPMASADGRWIVSYNGEIYNFEELRSQLGGQGLSFRGGSDTEVLVGAVQAWGVERTLDRIEGMFAIALWDRQRAELHLVRDRFGEKPLYYGWVGRRLAFASELKAFHVLPGFFPTLDRGAIASFLRHNCVPAPATVFAGIAKLAPGRWITFTEQDGPGSHPPPRAYWSASEAIAEAMSEPGTGNDDDLVDRLEEVLSDAVAARMVADVPVGAFLSGGVDSSVIVALMQRAGRRPVHTFSVGFADRAFDESVDAAAVAAHLGTDHTSLRVTDQDAASVIPRLPEIWDEPFADVSQIPMLLVSELARTQVTVALSGDGGDELFAGYNRHAWLDRLWRRGAALPDPVRRLTGSALQALPPGFVDGAAGITRVLPARMQVRTPSTKVAKVGRVLAASGPEGAYRSLTSHWEQAESMVVGAPPSVPSSSVPPSPLSDITELMLLWDVTGYLPDDILTKVDRAAMSTSLETRVPFLDRRVFELAWKLPMSVKLRSGTTKWILRQVLYRHVPPTLVDRPKMGFGVPIGAWLRGPLRPWAEELLGPRRLGDQGVLDPAPVRTAWKQHLSGRRDFGYELWDVLVLQAWLDRWLPGG
jgi:asparagine synthase (glutamine-hydrolysing)